MNADAQTVPLKRATISDRHVSKLNIVGRQGACVDEMKTRHHAFHRTLLVACGSDWLLDFFERLDWQL